jgi:virulence-associated protein VapD
MILIKKNLILTILVGVMILLVTPADVLSRIMQNGAGTGYDESDETSGFQSGYLNIGNTIERYVIKGAGYYLDAYSDILAFLNRMELSDMQGMDYNESRQILDRAMANMIDVLKIYERLIKKAEVTPYNEAVISKLMEFDYNGFMQERGLNSVIFGKVEDHLKRGDITGLLRQMYTEFAVIAGLLSSVRDELNLEKLTEMSKVWRLNERCSQALLFGQYGSMVFYAVL